MTHITHSVIQFSDTPTQNSGILFPFFRTDTIRLSSRIIFEGLSAVQKRSVKKVLGDPNLPQSGTVPVYTSEGIVLILLLNESSDIRDIEEKGTTLFSVAQQYALKKISLLPGSLKKSQDKWESLIDGVFLGEYQFESYRGEIHNKEQEQKKKGDCIECIIVGTENYNRSAWVQGVSLTKNIINTPPSEATPSFVEKQIRTHLEGKKNINITALHEEELKKHGMNGILSVGQASDEDSRLLVIEYNGGKKDDQPIVFVGKGVTYDTGGLSLKPAVSMKGMKKDLGGASTVIGAVYAIASAELSQNVVAVIPLAENLIGKDAYKPDDIIRMANGVTVEITNTDAEGRLLLGDALWYAETFCNPQCILDIATLTGACVYALGEDITAVFSTTDELMEIIENASNKVHEPVWRLPLYHRYKKKIRSQVADIMNAAYGFRAGTIQAGLFLQHFVQEKTPWAHFDIAFSSYNDDKNRATGRHVRTFFEIAKSKSV